MSYIQEIIAFIVGGGLTQGYTVYRESKKSTSDTKRDEFVTLVSEFKHLLDEYKERIAESKEVELACKQRILILEQKVDDQNKRIKELENLHHERN